MIACVDCRREFDGTRSDARRAQWEPFSTKTQALMDAGPMVCPECVKKTIDDAIDALRAHFIRYPDFDGEIPL